MIPIYGSIKHAPVHISGTQKQSIFQSPFGFPHNHLLLQIRGQCVDDFISQAQDRTRNAHSKSLAAAWNVWKQYLLADQVTFASEMIACPGFEKPQMIVSLKSETHFFKLIHRGFLHLMKPRILKRLSMCPSSSNW